MSRGGLGERPFGNAHCDEMAAIAAMQIVLALAPILSQGSPETNMLLRMTDSNSDALDPGPQGRCVCGEKVAIADAHEVTLPNGRAGWQGYCPECGAPLFAIRRGSRASS